MPENRRPQLWANELSYQSVVVWERSGNGSAVSIQKGIVFILGLLQGRDIRRPGRAPAGVPARRRPPSLRTRATTVPLQVRGAFGGEDLAFAEELAAPGRGRPSTTPAITPAR
ncbi:hypothetical protein GCM10010304_64920 [Streptomyces roseoviolaceus]